MEPLNVYFCTPVALASVYSYVHNTMDNNFQKADHARLLYEGHPSNI